MYTFPWYRIVRRTGVASGPRICGLSERIGFAAPVLKQGGILCNIKSTSWLAANTCATRSPLPARPGARFCPVTVSEANDE